MIQQSKFCRSVTFLATSSVVLRMTREPPAGLSAVELCEDRELPSANSTLSPGGFLGGACAPNRGDRLRSDASGTHVCLRRQSIHPTPSRKPHQHQQHDGSHEVEHVVRLRLAT